jgi:two-component system sensor histidine kinase KdpD
MDFVLMGQAISNVLDNAIKYSPPGSPIDIGATISDGELRLQIGDRGPGVPPAELDRIFHKFHRIRRPSDTGGVGLGLSISAGIVDLHGGRIWAENRANGGGAVMTLAVPLDRP